MMHVDFGVLVWMRMLGKACNDGGWWNGSCACIWGGRGNCVGGRKMGRVRLGRMMNLVTSSRAVSEVLRGWIRLRKRGPRELVGGG